MGFFDVGGLRRALLRVSATTRSRPAKKDLSLARAMYIVYSHPVNGAAAGLYINTINKRIKDERIITATCYAYSGTGRHGTVSDS